MQKKEKDSRTSGRNLPTKFALTARALVGGYLLYVSYSLIDSVVHGEGTRRYLMGFFLAAYAVIGVLLLFFACRSLIYGRYVGGAADIEPEEENPEEEPAIDTETGQAASPEAAEADTEAGQTAPSEPTEADTEAGRTAPSESTEAETEAGQTAPSEPADVGK